MHSFAGEEGSFFSGLNQGNTGNRATRDVNRSDSSRGGGGGDLFDLDQFLFDKKTNLEHFFGTVHDELSS